MTSGIDFMSPTSVDVAARIGKPPPFVWGCTENARKRILDRQEVEFRPSDYLFDTLKLLH